VINSGWANDCGKELFTIGWVTCDIVEPIEKKKIGGGTNFSYAPSRLKEQLLREDEEILAVIMAFMRIID